MPRRAKPLRFPVPRGAARFFLALNLAVAVVLGGWFGAQPSSRQREVRRLVETTFERDKRVTALDVAWDLWQLYYADSATGHIASGDKTLV
jgi:endonuclease G